MPRASKSSAPPCSGPGATRSSTGSSTSCTPRRPTPCCSGRCQSIRRCRNCFRHCSAICSPYRSPSLSRFGRQDSHQAPAPFPPRDDQSVEAKAAAIMVEGKDQLDHQKEEIGPGPLPLGIVEPEPQIEDLQRADQTPEAHENPQDQRYGRQYLESVNRGGKQVEVRQYHVVDETTRQRNPPAPPPHTHPIAQTR